MHGWRGKRAESWKCSQECEQRRGRSVENSVEVEEDEHKPLLWTKGWISFSEMAEVQGGKKTQKKRTIKNLELRNVVADMVVESCWGVSFVLNFFIFMMYLLELTQLRCCYHCFQDLQHHHCTKCMVGEPTFLILDFVFFWHQGESWRVATSNRCDFKNCLEMSVFWYIIHLATKCLAC